jgi:transposase-like protein
MLQQDIIESTETRSEAIQWARHKGLLYSTFQCNGCQCQMNLETFEDQPDYESFRCPKCHARRSIRVDSIFFDSRLSIQKIMLLVYNWGVNRDINDVSRELELSANTVRSWYSKIRGRVCKHSTWETAHPPIGGFGKVVEIDESVVSRRKYHRGRLVKEKWVFGGVERCAGTSKPFFIELVPNRTANTLLEVIQRRIAPGTTIMSDGWRAYRNIPRYKQYRHLAVNHSKNFVDPSNCEIHTQNVENQWRHLKSWLRKKGTNLGDNISQYLLEYCFKKHNNDVFGALLALFRLQ